MSTTFRESPTKATDVREALETQTATLARIEDLVRSISTTFRIAVFSAVGIVVAKLAVEVARLF